MATRYRISADIVAKDGELSNKELAEITEEVATFLHGVAAPGVVQRNGNGVKLVVNDDDYPSRKKWATAHVHVSDSSNTCRTCMSQADDEIGQVDDEF